MCGLQDLMYNVIDLRGAMKGRVTALFLLD